jgi:hypothetical protein
VKAGAWHDAVGPRSYWGRITPTQSIRRRWPSGSASPARAGMSLPRGLEWLLVQGAHDQGIRACARLREKATLVATGSEHQTSASGQTRQLAGRASGRWMPVSLVVRRHRLRYRRPVPGIFLRRDEGELVHLHGDSSPLRFLTRHCRSDRLATLSAAEQRRRPSVPDRVLDLDHSQPALHRRRFRIA